MQDNLWQLLSVAMSYRHGSPEQSRWKVYWARCWCFGSQKHKKRIAPASSGDGANCRAGAWPLAQADLALAPPSSPASLVNSISQSPSNFTLPLAASVSMASPSFINPMFTVGPYAHETQSVSPPAFSTFSTEPSTASLTPPPELAPHITMPSSPDVPAAQLISSSLKARDNAKGNISRLSASTLGSPCDIPVSYTSSLGPLYLGSSVNHLDSPAPRQAGACVSPSVQSFLSQPSSRRYGGVPSLAAVQSFALNLPCDSNPLQNNVGNYW